MAIREKQPYPHDLPRISYAQNSEDILIDRLFRGKVGTFVDIGSCNPVVDSNTQFFYERGWRGVNFEPRASSFQLFLDQRSQDLNLNVAASDFDGELTFYEVDDHGINGISTLSAEIAQGHRQRGFEVVETRVPVRTVRGLVREYDIDPPDLLSIDVEAHEYQVIRGIDLEHWRPKLIVVESTIPCTPEPSYQSWEPKLLEHGYRFMVFNGLNRFYLRDDLQHLARHFETPVNIFDDFLPYARVRAEADTAEVRRELDQEREQHERARLKLAREEADTAEVRRELDQEREQHERARLELQKEHSKLLRLRIAHSELARRESFCQHQCRHLEGQRDELGAQVDHLYEELDALRSGLATLRSELDDRRARTIAATG